MAKKRKSSRKQHRFSPDHITGGVAAASPERSSGGVQTPQVTKADAAVAALGFATAQVVRRDVGRVLVLAAGFIVVMLGLWVLFTHTSIGPTVYNSVKL